MSTDRYTSAALWLIFLGLLVIVAVPFVLGRSWHDYFFPPQAGDFAEMADEARPATWVAEDDFERTEFERRPLLGRLTVPIGFHLTATTHMLTDVRISGLRLVVVDDADQDVVVNEVSVRQGGISEPQRVVSVTGFIPKPYRGWYLELMTTTWDGFHITYGSGELGDRM